MSSRMLAQILVAIGVVLVQGAGLPDRTPTIVIAQEAGPPDRQPTVLVVSRLQCPMPVFVPDTALTRTMPVVRPRAEVTDRMPVAPPGCVNPLMPGEQRSQRVAEGEARSRLRALMRVRGLLDDDTVASDVPGR